MRLRYVVADTYRPERDVSDDYRNTVSLWLRDAGELFVVLRYLRRGGAKEERVMKTVALLAALIASIVVADSATAQRNLRDRTAPNQAPPPESVAPEGAPKPGELRGSVVLEFTITVEGTVKDIVVVESTHPGMFDEAAVSALSRWRYNPKIENGQPVERRGVKTKITFVLED
jgi:TonB family protein